MEEKSGVLVQIIYNICMLIFIVRIYAYGY